VRLPIIVLTCLIATTSASAQATWRGLHFGESLDEVRTQLTAQNMPVATSQEGALQATSDYDLAIPGLRYAFPMRVTFHFDDSAKLADVTLALDLPGMRRYWAAIGSDEALSTFAAEKLMGALSGRYGTPLYRSTACDADTKTPSFCIVSWHATEQTVELERGTSARGMRLLVRYQPLATDL
jgi:hypothetical protein